MLYVAVATRAFRRYATYRAATLAGIFTNSVFGVIYSYVYLALWTARPGAGGYDAVDAVTYVWLGQALLMTVALWGGGSTDDLAARIRTGDVAIDLYRPVGLVGWYLAADLGRAAYHLLTRGLAPTVVGFVLFDIRLPDLAGAALFAVSIVLAVVTSFGFRFLVACSAFWLLDQSGVQLMSGVLAIFFSGLALPLVIFPEPLRSIALVLPWASYLQTPADVWLGTLDGTGLLAALGLQVAWAVVLLGCCRAVVGAATRRVVVQGG
ncbi:ABC transporter permease [Nocardioides euryhalodurans]|uniref:ABC transporter permease n=1 Tax=Nocardioides euryhalodurans TaxID=2518370 RepID=A0A4P7GGW0_9ACTN|nr:ABC-2 family transporter protein [Nocardioides euryhalodurans]QBR91110.1 ABC transporter permease [Nocardioides euryhalodurans]